MAPRALRLYGYIKQEEERRFVGVCLTLNLVVEGPTFEQTRCKIDDLIVAYLEDAHEHQELDAFVPRRAPLGFYIEYWIGFAQSWLAWLKRPFFPFSESKPLPRHA